MYETERSVKAFLDGGDLHYLHKKEIHSFLLSVDMEEAGDCMMAITAHDEEDLSCHVVYKDNVPEHARKNVVEYLTRANYGLFLGNFQMDMDDGQIVYQVGTVHSDQIVSKEEIARMVHVAGEMVRRYGKGLQDVIDGVCSPEEAVAKAERRKDPFGDIDEEVFASADSEDDEDGYRELITALNDEQLDHLMQAVGKAMADHVGVKRKRDPIPEEYLAVVEDLQSGELLKLSLLLLRERFRRLGVGPDVAEEQKEEETSLDEMSEAEMRRRAAVLSLKVRMREKLAGSGHATDR